MFANLNETQRMFLFFVSEILLVSFDFGQMVYQMLQDRFNFSEPFTPTLVNWIFIQRSAFTHHRWTLLLKVNISPMLFSSYWLLLLILWPLLIFVCEIVRY